MGFATIPMSMIAINFSVELTYPAPEAMSNGMMILPNKIFGATVGIVAGILCEYSPMYAIALLTFNAMLCAACAFFIKEEFRRINFKGTTL